VKSLYSLLYSLVVFVDAAQTACDVVVGVMSDMGTAQCVLAGLRLDKFVVGAHQLNT
jgi:hypothetical protein